jgi:hypothetical protein
VIFGGENEKRPFISVHNMLDSNFSIHGFNTETYSKLETRVKDRSQFSCEEDYLAALEEYQTAKNNDQIGYMSFPTLNRCIFNVKIFSQQKFSKIIACTDFSSTLLLLELHDRGSIRIIAQTHVHTDLIQGLMVHENSIYTCSADKNICRVHVNLKYNTTEDLGYGGQGARKVPLKSQSLLLPI